MRLFLGFAPALAERHIYGVCQRLTPADELPLKWVPAENWHVTVAFLGEVDERALARLDAAVEPVTAMFRPFSLALSGLDWFPSTLKPRLLTLKVETSDALLSLQREVVGALRREGFHTENRAYRPHLTLARLKGARRRFNPPALPPVATIEFQAEELVLFQSITGGQASVYRPLQRFELAA
jgi:2'-5' RNA ligase